MGLRPLLEIGIEIEKKATRPVAFFLDPFPRHLEAGRDACIIHAVGRGPLLENQISVKRKATRSRGGLSRSSALEVEVEVEGRACSVVPNRSVG